jgi:hypothetical protein
VLGERERHGRRAEPHQVLLLLLLLGRGAPARRGRGREPAGARRGGAAHVVQAGRQPNPGAGARRRDGQTRRRRHRRHPRRQVHLLQGHALHVGRVVLEAADARARGRRPLERRPPAHRRLRRLRDRGRARARALLHDVHRGQLRHGSWLLFCRHWVCLLCCLLLLFCTRRRLLERRELVVVHRASLKTHTREPSCRQPTSPPISFIRQSITGTDRRRIHCVAYLDVGEVDVVVLEEGDELPEVLLGREVVAAVGPYRPEDALLGDQPPGGRGGGPGQEARVLELALALLPDVQRPAGAQHEDPLGLLVRAHRVPALPVHEPPFLHDDFVRRPLVLLEMDGTTMEISIYIARDEQVCGTRKRLFQGHRPRTGPRYMMSCELSLLRGHLW